METLTKITDKPIISYGYIKEGADKGLCSIKANGVHIKTISWCDNGITSSWQENTLSKVHKACTELFKNGFILPYEVGGDGYVWIRL